MQRLAPSIGVATVSTIDDKVLASTLTKFFFFDSYTSFSMGAAPSPTQRVLLTSPPEGLEIPPMLASLKFHSSYGAMISISPFKNERIILPPRLRQIPIQPDIRMTINLAEGEECIWERCNVKISYRILHLVRSIVCPILHIESLTSSAISIAPGSPIIPSGSFVANHPRQEPIRFLFSSSNSSNTKHRKDSIEY
jgi:hypothetical protein